MWSLLQESRPTTSISAASSHLILWTEEQRNSIQLISLVFSVIYILVAPGSIWEELHFRGVSINEPANNQNVCRTEIQINPIYWTVTATWRTMFLFESTCRPTPAHYRFTQSRTQRRTPPAVNMWLNVVLNVCRSGGEDRFPVPVQWTSRFVACDDVQKVVWVKRWECYDVII